MPEPSPDEALLPDFGQFQQDLLHEIRAEFSRLSLAANSMSPCLIHIEEILVGTRTLCARATMGNYYRHWEEQLYQAVLRMNAQK